MDSHSDRKFFQRFAILVSEISRMLGLAGTTNVAKGDRPVERSLLEIIDYHDKGLHNPRDWELARLTFFAQHLRELQENHPLLFAFYKKKLRSRRLDDYLGARFEINVATTLLKNGLTFTTPDPPDFQLTWQDTNLSIECGTIHLTGPKHKDPKYKIRRLINRKAKKGYCSSTTALMVDFTNIHNETLRQGLISVQKDYYEELFRYGHKSICQTRFGSLVLFTYLVDLERETFRSVYKRLDNKVINRRLFEMLDTILPSGEYRPRNFRIPLHG